MSWVVDVAVAVIPVLLGWIGRVVRRIDKRTERVESHERILFGDERDDGRNGIVPKVRRHERILDGVALTDGGENGS